MVRPTTREMVNYWTTGDLCLELDLSRRQISDRLETGVFPPPTEVNEHGVRLFDEEWLRMAKIILKCERGMINPSQKNQQLEKIKEEFNESE